MIVSVAVLVLACEPAPWKDFSTKSPSGQFELKVTQTQMSLRDTRTGATRWTRDTLDRGPYLVPDSGSWVLELKHPEMGCTACVTAELFDATGKTVARLDLLSKLDQDERHNLTYSDCGIGWLRSARVDGDHAVVEVTQAGQRRPNEDQGPALQFTIDGKTGAVTRSAKIPAPTIAALITQFQNLTDPGERLAVEVQLFERAGLPSSKHDPSLIAFFWGRLRDDADDRGRRAAVRMLAELGNPEDLEKLAAFPAKDDETRLELAKFIEGHDPARAQREALAALLEHRPPSAVRRRASELVIRTDSPDRQKAAEAGLSDPDPLVRRSAFLAVARLSEPVEWTYRLLSSHAATDTEFQNSDNWLESFVHPSRPDSGVWRERVLADARAGRFSNWAPGLLMAGSIAELKGDPTVARRLYQECADLLDRQRADAKNKTRLSILDNEPWLEVKLRLAWLDSEEQRPAQAMKLAQQVLDADARAEERPVCFGEPLRPLGGTCSMIAAFHAKELIARKGAPLSHPLSAADRQAMFDRHVKMLNEIRKAADERDAALRSKR